MPRSTSEAATRKRFDKAIDLLLNSGVLSEFMDDFWRYVDGKMSWAEFQDRMPR